MQPRSDPAGVDCKVNMRVQVGDADAIHLCQIHNPLSIVLYIDRRVYVYLEAAGVGVGVRTQHPERGGREKAGSPAAFLEFLS